MLPAGCSIDPVALASSALPANRTVCRIGGNALLSGVSGKVISPVPQRCLPDVESQALLVHRLENQLDMRMWLIGVQSHGVSVLHAELLTRERPGGGKRLVRRSSGWHGEGEIAAIRHGRPSS
jgi:hypothetical protein